MTSINRDLKKRRWDELLYPGTQVLKNLYGIRDEFLAKKLFALQRLLHAKIFLQQVLAKQQFLNNFVQFTTRFFIKAILGRGTSEVSRWLRITHDLSLGRRYRSFFPALICSSSGLIGRLLAITTK